MAIVSPNQSTQMFEWFHFRNNGWQEKEKKDGGGAVMEINVKVD